MKPGYKTTEFWLSVAKQLVSLAVVVGMLSTQDAGTIGGALSDGITAAAALIANAQVLAGYVKSRAAVKAGEASKDS